MKATVAWSLVAVLAGAASTVAAVDESTASIVEPVDLGRVDARVGALLIAGGGRGVVDGASTARLVPTEGGTHDLRLSIEVDGAALLESAPEGPAPIALAAYVMDDEGRLRHFLSRGVVLDRRTREQVAAVGLRWVDVVTLEPGVYSVRMVVRHQLTGSAFLDRLRVVVGEGVAIGPSLLPPLVGSSSSGWVTALAKDVPEAEECSSARVVWPVGTPLELGVGGTGLSAEQSLRARLVDRAGRTFEEPALEVTGDAGGIYRTTTVAPVDAPEGRYRLVIRAPGPEGDREALAGLEVIVTSSAVDEPWPRVTLGDERERVPTDGKDLRNRQMRGAYLEALQALAAGDPIEARRRLADLERRVAASDSATALARLGRIQRDVASDLARENALAVRPVVWLHRTMNRYYRVRRESVLGTHSWNTVASVAVVLAARGDRRDRDFATDVMTEQANELVLVPAMRAATDLLQRTLQLDAGHADALMALGASQERQGLYVEAARAFRRAAQARPGYHEATLRLGVNLARSGAAASARDLFRELIDGPAPGWVRTVAAQELARELVEGRKPGEAVRILTEIRPEVETNQRLAVQLAHALESAGQPERAAAMLDSIEADLDSGPSPRLRYAEWPDLGPRVDHQGLQERAELGRVALAQVLDENNGAS